MSDLLLLGVRRLRGQPTRFRGPYDTRRLAGRDEVLAAVDLALADTTWERAGRRNAGFRVAVLDGRTVHELRSGVDQVREEAPIPALLRLLWHLPDEAVSAAEGLAVLCELVVAAEPTVGAETLVERLAEQAAGISPGLAGWADLLRAGDDRLPGTGFLPTYDDGSLGQVRHFAGSCAAALRLGPALTRAASLARGDLPSGADHRLTLAAISFTRGLMSGTLTPAEAGTWIRTHLVADPR